MDDGKASIQKKNGFNKCFFTSRPALPKRAGLFLKIKIPGDFHRPGFVFSVRASLFQMKKSCCPVKLISPFCPLVGHCHNRELTGFDNDPRAAGTTKVNKSQVDRRELSEGGCQPREGSRIHAAFTSWPMDSTAGGRCPEHNAPFRHYPVARSGGHRPGV